VWSWVERQPGGSSKVHNSVHALGNFTGTYMCTLEPLLISVIMQLLLLLLTYYTACLLP
jgi:hypothetical protein